MISIKNEQTIAIDIKKIKNDSEEILSFIKYPDYDLGILLADTEKMHFFNKTFREKDKPTDILSFPFYPELKPGEKIKPLSTDDKNLGDIILCPAYIKKDLPRWQETFQERIQTLLIHGICHLLGYDHIDDNDYKVMKEKEELIKNYLKNKCS